MTPSDHASLGKLAERYEQLARRVRQYVAAKQLGADVLAAKSAEADARVLRAAWEELK